MVKKNFLKSSLIVLVALAMVLPVIPTISFAASKPIITYSAHMQTYGWDKTNKAPNSELTAKDAAKNYAGTIGESKRMEALEVNLSTLPGVTLKYRAHVQTFGWQDWVTADTKANHTATVGTVGLSKRVEALQISVDGLKEQGYKLLYRAHVQTYGWLDWVDADDPNAYAGTSGESKRMEAFEIVVVPKEEYTYEDNENGTHSISYKGILQKTDAPCSYGEWTPTSDGSTEYEQECALCGHNSGEKTTLQDALTKAYTDGAKEVKAENVTLTAGQTLTVPAGVTLEVADTLNVDNDGKLVVDGEVTTKYLGDSMISTNNNVTVSENGSFTVSGKYDGKDANGGTANIAADKAILAKAANLPYVTNIVLEEGSLKQDLSTTQLAVTSEKLTVDLNGTEVTSAVESKSMIKTTGDLTVNNGVFVNTVANGFLLDGKGSLTINGGSITTKGTAVCANGKKEESASTDTADKYDLAGMTVNLSNVDIEITENTNTAYAINLYGNNGLATLNNVNITTKGAKGVCLGTSANTKNTSYKVTGGKLVSNCMVAYIPAVGDNEFTNVEMVGLDGIEVAGGSLTVRGSTITATRESITTAVTKNVGADLNNGSADILGAGIILKIKNGYAKDTEKFDLTVTNSTVKSNRIAAILVVENSADSDGSCSSIKTVNTNYSGSTIQGYVTAAEVASKDATMYALRNGSKVVIKNK